MVAYNEEQTEALCDPNELLQYVHHCLRREPATSQSRPLVKLLLN